MKEESKYKKEFEKLFSKFQSSVFILFDERVSERKKIYELEKNTSFKKYVNHFVKYYALLASKNNIFLEILEDKHIEEIEQKTADSYLTLRDAVFSSIPEGDSFVYFFVNPDKYYNKSMKNSLSLSGDNKLLFQKLFEFLKKNIPSNLNYSTTLAFDSQTPGGVFYSKENKIVFGDHLKANLRNLLGLLHEFGHSVYALAKENKRELSNDTKYYDMALNEAYAELWANKIEIILKEIGFPLVVSWIKVRKQLKFNFLLTLRYHLMYMVLARELKEKKITSFSDCYKIHRELGKKFLYIENFPILFPLMPQISQPGYLSTYLAINFVTEGYLPKISQKHFFQDLFKIAKKFQGFHSKAAYKSFIQDSFVNYMKAL